MVYSRRGIILLTSLVLTVVIVMFLGAAMALGPGNLAAGQDVLSLGHAQRAAESGIQYALAQLRQNPAWRGDRNAVTVNSGGLWVQEDNGNVVGLVQEPGGTWSQFRLRFNYQDGAAGADALDDPAVLQIDHPYVSLNNLNSGAVADVYRADGPGYSVTGTSAFAFQAPLWAVSLAVEGKAGPACSALSPANPNPSLTGRVSRKVVEGLYQIPDMGPSVQESGSMTGDNFNIELKPGSIGKAEVVAKNGTPRVRSKGTVAVSGGDPAQNYVSVDGEVKSSDSALAATYDSTKVTVNGEAAVDPFYQLAWSEVKKADPAGPKLPAGTYVWWDDGSLHYYDMSYEDYTAFISDPANVGSPGYAGVDATTILPAEVTLDPLKKKVILTGSVYVEPGATNELNLIPRLGAPEAPPGDPEATEGPATEADFLTSLPAPVTGTAASTGIIGTGPAAAMWTVPITSPMTTSPLTVQTGVSSMGTWRALQLVDNGNGTATLKADAGWVGSLFSPSVTVDPNGALADGFSQFAADPNFTAMLPYILGAGGDNGVIAPADAPGDTLTAKDLSIDLKPPKGEALTLTSEGSIKLTGKINGVGSITSGGDISITGEGATINAYNDSVNLYSKGDITFSTLVETGDAGSGTFAYKDVKLKGVIYSQGDFTAKLGSTYLPGAWGKFELKGILIAYGADPSLPAPAGLPGANGDKGKADIRALSTKLEFDPVYAAALSSKPPADFSVKCISWTNHF